MNNYTALVKYYDFLLHDELTLTTWINNCLDNKDNLNILDMACGSGNASMIFNELNNHVYAFDISKEMIDLAKQKDVTNKIDYQVKDMLDFNYNVKFDIVVCFMDSLNYINSLDNLKVIFNNVYNHLNDKGKFIFDYHLRERLIEFKEEYIEEGYVLDTPYQWSICSDGDNLLSRFVFYEDILKSEEHIQYIFDIKDLMNILSDIGFKVKIDNLNDEKYYVEAIK